MTTGFWSRLFGSGDDDGRARQMAAAARQALDWLDDDERADDTLARGREAAQLVNDIEAGKVKVSR